MTHPIPANLVFETVQLISFQTIEGVYKVDRSRRVIRPRYVIKL